MDNDFLINITEIVEKNISNDQFGVSELADEINMSRSNLLRKVKKLTDLSVSQFIRQIRLNEAMEMLKQKSLTVSEVSFKVGFSSTSYFIKCFGEQYGYPPGEVGKGDSIKNSSHQLAAIMFTDIEGYTALMQQNEEKAVGFRSRHREVFNALNEKFKGNILQYYGDGTLSTFPSAIDAVNCGIEMQLAFRKEPKIPVRIGIHSGDILFTEDDIIGDGVNVASRVESLAAPQSVFISDKVYDEVKNQPGIQTVSMGKFELKNVAKPIEVFAISNPGLFVPDSKHISGKLKNEVQPNNMETTAAKESGWIKWAVILLAAVLVGYLIYDSSFFRESPSETTIHDPAISKKSVAVLPFINDSNDSTNVYLINGLMESILNNLQQIEGLRVISRTSVEKYRNNPKLISEIAKELNVNYFVEGSGQKIGDQILLNVQLIDANNDKHLWAEQYKRQIDDIFDIQMEVAKKIAGNIEVIITPEEEERINKPPTDNLLAYEYFLKGLDLFHLGNQQALEESIIYFEKAIAEDDKFARAYADIAMAYYLLDANQTEKQYTNQINNYADKALLLDSQLSQSLMAKAFYYMQMREYEPAVAYLENALKFNPNSALVINTLSEFYTNYVPNTEKYLEYALKGIQLDIAAHDSVTTSIIYLHVSNAFVQTGFISEAEKYINKSLDYLPENLFSEYVKAYILYAGGGSLEELNTNLLNALNKDSTRLDIIQEVAKSYYYMRDFENSYRYYKKFTEIKELYKLNMYTSEDAKIGVVLSKMGLTAESEKTFAAFKAYADNDQSIYKPLSLAVYYAHQNDTDKALKFLRQFAEADNYHFWMILFLEIDPLIDNIKDLPKCRKILDDLETKFWKNHNQIKASLKEEGLI